MKVFVFIRNHEPWPGEFFRDGVRHAGDRVAEVETQDNDAIVTWNCYGVGARMAARARAAGKVHFVAENGYLRRDLGTVLLERNGHNGSGAPIRPRDDAYPERFHALRIKCRSWQPVPRTVDAPLIVVGQRGGGYSPLAMQNDWPTNTCKLLLERFPTRHIIYRSHPERDRAPRIEHPRLHVFGATAKETLKNLILANDPLAVITWTGNAITEAVLCGVTPVYAGPSVALSELSLTFDAFLRAPVDAGDAVRARPQLPYLHELAWNQWTRAEIAAGFPWLLVTGRMGREEVVRVMRERAGRYSVTGR